MKKTQPDYYAVLGIQRDAKPGAIKQAYRELVRKYHPDAAGSSAQARAQFEQLQEAYEILSDPSKRGEYDAKLPPRKYPAAELDAESLWREATQLIFERSDSFSNLIQTMRIAVAIALEGDLLVVGVAGKDQYLAGHLAIPGNRYRINQTLREISGREIEYRVIEGTEKEDWDFVKRAEGHRTVPEEPAPEVAPQPAARKAAKAEGEIRVRAAPQVTAWELLGRKIHNTWNGTPNRQHPLTRAEYLLTCVHWISETSKEAMEEGAAADSVRREVGKAIERVAQLLDIPPTMVALELMRGQHRRRAG
jgi:curved DNA-binding protein CbpA